MNGKIAEMLHALLGHWGDGERLGREKMSGDLFGAVRLVRHVADIGFPLKGSTVAVYGGEAGFFLALLLAIYRPKAIHFFCISARDMMARFRAQVDCLMEERQRIGQALAEGWVLATGKFKDAQVMPLDELMHGLGIHLHTVLERFPIPLHDHSLDLFAWCSASEKVSPDMQSTLQKEGMRLLRPGGVIAHQIDATEPRGMGSDAKNTADEVRTRDEIVRFGNRNSAGDLVRRGHLASARA